MTSIRDSVGEQIHILRGFSVSYSLCHGPRPRDLPCDALSLDLLLDLVLDLVLDLLGLLLDLLHHLGDLVTGTAGHQDAADLDNTDEAEEEVDGCKAVFFLLVDGILSEVPERRTGSSWA